ncbi:MAG: hypothetical protein ABIG36_21195, partial [Pseudomonadota bacterium]
DRTIGGNLVIAEAASPTLSTGAGTAGNILITGTTNGTAGGVAESLTVQAGTGTATFTGNVGNNTNATELEALTITNAAATTFSGTLDLAGALTQTNAATGTTTFTGAVSVGSADLKGTDYALDNSFASAGNFSLIGTGVNQLGALTVAGTSTLGFGTGNSAALAHAGNNFVGTVSVVSGNNVTLNDIDTIDFGNSSVSGGLVVTASGAITDSGNISVGGGSTLTAGAANDITLDNANSFGGAVAVVSAKDVLLNAMGAINLGPSTISGYLDVTAGGSITQSGILNITGDLWAKTTGGNIDFGLSNHVGGTVSLITPLSNGVAGAGNSIVFKSDHIKVGLARPSGGAESGITAARVTIETVNGSGDIDYEGKAGSTGLITADAPLGATASLTIRTTSANGVIGDSSAPTTKGLRVQTSGLVQVFGDGIGDGTIFLIGDDAVQPKYEFSGDPLHRIVKYNGVDATNAQLTGALDAAYLDIRNQTTEIRESGFAKENASKVLRRGVVTSAGPGQPAVDDSTGLAGMELCDGTYGNDALACQ